MEREGKQKYYSIDVARIVNGDSRSWAIATGSTTVGVDHLFLALAHTPYISRTLVRMEVDIDELTKKIQYGESKKAIEVPPPFVSMDYDDEVRDIVEDAQKDSTHKYVVPVHLMLNVLLRQQENPTMGLEKMGITYASFKNAVLSAFPEGRQRDNLRLI